MLSILDIVKEQISPEFLHEAATKYSESEISIAKAISCIAPTVLAGVLVKSGDSHSVDKIFELLKNADPGMVNLADSLTGDGSLVQKDAREATLQLFDLIFGAKVPAITHAVAAFSGVSKASASALLALGTSMTMGLLQKKINDEGLNSSTLVRYLLSQKSIFMGVLPSGIAALLGMANAGTNSNSEKPLGNLGWLWPLLILIILVGAIILYLKNC
jgi:hypothetical protein